MKVLVLGLVLLLAGCGVSDSGISDSTVGDTTVSDSLVSDDINYKGEVDFMRNDLFEKVDSGRALELLKEGNARFVSGDTAPAGDVSAARTELSQKGQVPFAVILGCSDSRVPPEVVFDVNVGQIFVVRTAGNVVDAIAIGSVEYAVEHLGAELVVVLGHQKCGAVAAAVGGGDHGPNIGAIVNEINPSVEKVRAQFGDDDISHKCEDENVQNTVAKLAQSEILAEHMADDSLKIVGAKYSLDTGEVKFFL